MQAQEGLESGGAMFPLQDEVLRCRKELSTRENEWKREKVMLLQRCEILNMEVAELKHRESNLKKVNETLTLALSKVHDDGQEFKSLVEGLKNNTITSSEALKEDRKRLSEDRREIEQLVRSQLEADFKERGGALRAQLEREMEERLAGRLKEQEAHVRRSMTFDREKSERELKQIHYEECQKLKTELERLYRELDRLAVEEQLVTSTLLEGPQPGQYTRTLEEQNIATDLLCEICGVAVPANQFYEHSEVCNGEDEQEDSGYGGTSYHNLVRKKRHVESQLELLGKMEKGRKGAPGQSGGQSYQGFQNQNAQFQGPQKQVVYLINDGRKKSNIEREIKSIITNICSDKS